MTKAIVTSFGSEPSVFELVSSVLNISIEHAVLKTLVYSQQALREYETKMSKKASKGLRVPRTSSVVLAVDKEGVFKLKFKFYRYSRSSGDKLSVTCKTNNRTSRMDLDTNLYSEAVKSAISAEFDDVYLAEAK